MLLGGVLRWSRLDLLGDHASDDEFKYMGERALFDRSPLAEPGAVEPVFAVQGPAHGINKFGHRTEQAHAVSLAALSSAPRP